MAERSTEEQARIDALIGANLMRVRYLAAKMYRRLPHDSGVEYEELVSAGNVGLVLAAQRFDPSRGLKFSGYGAACIWGAFLDFLRGLQFMSSRERRQKKEDRPTPKVLPVDKLLYQMADPDDWKKHVDNRVAIGELLDRIDARLAMVIRLHFLNELTGREIGRRMGICESQISHLKAEALKAMREAARTPLAQRRVMAMAA
jgi:RNA polymerase sigma factor (sigma-70 family)